MWSLVYIMYLATPIVSYSYTKVLDTLRVSRQSALPTQLPWELSKNGQINTTPDKGKVPWHSQP